VKVLEKDTYDSLKARIQRAEHRAYPKAIKMFLEGQPRVAGRKVIFEGIREDDGQEE
jgi:phosphoribosylglycinamide formyltransferase-1